MTQEGTELPDADHSSLSRPASSAVLGELEVLREGVGVSPERIRRRAPEMQQLAVVGDQLEYQQLHPSDRHIAAYMAIGCVIEHGIGNYQHQQILILTLRYDMSMLALRRDPEAWNEVRRATTVSQRDALTQALLFYKKSAYFEMRKEAYAELANQLAMRTHTPCRANGTDRVAIEILRLTQRQILGYFTVEGRAVFRELLADEALMQLNFRWWPPSGFVGSSESVFNQAISQAIRDEYPAAVQEFVLLKRASTSDPRPDEEFCLSGDALESLLHPVNSFNIWQLFPEAGEQSRSSADPAIAIERLSNSLDVLAWILSTDGDSGPIDNLAVLETPNFGRQSDKPLYIDDRPIQRSERDIFADDEEMDEGDIDPDGDRTEQ